MVAIVDSQRPWIFQNIVCLQAQVHSLFCGAFCDKQACTCLAHYNPMNRYGHC